MFNYKYLIIGGGMAAAGAIRAIQKIDQTGTIGIISSEPYYPYARPPLSKKLWQGKPFESIWLNVENKNTDYHLKTRAVKIDPQGKKVHDDHDEVYQYEKLLISTGGTPRKLNAGFDDEIIYYRYLDDYNKLKEHTLNHQRYAVIGGGFIGSEIAAALAMNGKEVFMIFPEQGINFRTMPRDLSMHLNEYFGGKGVKIFQDDGIMNMSKNNSRYLIKTDNGKEIEADKIIAGLGIEPDTGLASEAGLAVNNGIHVDEYLNTSDGDIYAAGDVANFYNPGLGMRIRVEHEDNALKMGETAGLNMAGEKTGYTYLPYFYSDLFDLGYEAIGLTSPQLDVFCDWKEQYKKGVIYYLKNNAVQGMILWNVWDKVGNAREIIESKKSYHKEELKGMV